MKQMKKKVTLKQLFDNNRFLQVFSLIVAALAWLIVAMTQSYTAPKTIYNVPVTIDPQSAALSDIGLHAIDLTQQYVDVKVEGVRSVVGQLAPEDFSLSAKLTGITEIGTYDLAVVSSNQSPNPNYTIKSFSPSTVKVSFDRIETKTFRINEAVNGLGIASGFTEKNTSVTPNTVTITGPSAEVAKIDKCAITAELENLLDKTYAGTFPIILYDVNGDEIDPEKSYLSMDAAEAQLMIQVLKVTNLPLEVGFTNIPKGFPEEELLERVMFSQIDVTIAGPTDLIDRTTEIQLGYIDLKGVSLDTMDIEFPVPLPPPSDQFMRLDNVTSVVVSIDSSGLESTSFNISDPQMINVPAGFDVVPLAKNMYNVEFVGEKEILESMTSDDIVMEIDLSEREVTPGSYQIPVKISVPGKGLVWAVGNHSITVQVTEISAEE